MPVRQTIKHEISLRFNPHLPSEKRRIQHKYIHPFTGEPLFEAGAVQCMALDEIISEKMRAAALRKGMAPRDFYDLDFVLRNKYNPANPQVIDLFRKKLAEDGGGTDLKKYRVNMGRTNAEIKEMRLRLKEELFDVLTKTEKENFNWDESVKRINKAMESMIAVDDKNKE